MNQPIVSESALSAFFRNLPDTLRQPFSLALIGSVAAHLFFFLWLPLFMPEETKPEVKRVVRLLNSPLQTQAATSAIGLPPIPKTPDSTVKIPLGQNLTPSIPPDGSLYKFPDQTIPPAPPVFQFPSATTVLPSSLISRMLNSPQSTTRSNPTTTTSPAQTPLTTPPPPSGATDSKISPLTSGVVPSTPTTPTTPASPSADTVRPGERLLAENQRLRDSITFKSLGATSYEIANTNITSYRSWYQKNVTDHINDKNLATKPPIPVLDVPYRSPFNLTEKFEPAYINVLIDPDGKIVAPLTVIGRTGYGILDDLARDEVSKLVISDQKAGKLTPTGDDAGKYVLRKYIVTFKVSRTA